MGKVRMTGLVSGFDTESMVRELVDASSTKVNKAKQEKQKLEWKKEAWQDLNTKLYNFYKDDLYNLRLSGSYNKKTTTVSDESKVSISANSGATNGLHTVSVKQVASSAYMTGANIKKAGNSYTTYADASTSTKFEDMKDSTGASLNLTGEQIKIKNGDKTLTFELGGTGDNGVANLDELNQKLAADEDFKGLKASVKDGKITFTNETIKKDEDGNDTGKTFEIEADAFGLSGTVDFKDDEAAGKVSTLSGSLETYYKKDFSSSDITRDTKLSDIGIAVGTSFSINGQDFVVDDKTTLMDLADGLSKMGVNANFDAGQGRFYINSADSGASNNFTLTSSDSDALEILGLGSGATKIEGQDAIIEYNGVEYTSNSNKFEINGMTINAKAVTGNYNKETGEFTDDSPITLTVGNDTEGVYDSIKSFVKKYNELIDQMNSLYNEKTTDYDPLTDDEKSTLSDKQIEKWEEKAKQGLLRRDSTISTLLSNMRNILNSAVEVTNADGSKSKVTLASLGIVTGDYSENGKLHILGDPDDTAYSNQENKLKKALEETPDIFSQVFAKTADGADGIGTKFYSYMGTAMKSKEGLSHSLTFYDDIAMDDKIDDYDDKIKDLNKKLQDMEDKYYDQFAKMESAMAKLQTQQSYLASLMGTA